MKIMILKDGKLERIVEGKGFWDVIGKALFFLIEEIKESTIYSSGYYNELKIFYISTSKGYYELKMYEK